MSLTGKDGGTKFRSKFGGGHWIDTEESQANPAIGQLYTLSVPKELAVDFGQRKAKGLVPCIGIRVRATVTADRGAGATPIFMTRDQLASFINVNIVNSMKKPYSQQHYDLLRWTLIGRAINPDVDLLDEQFPGREGIVPKTDIDFTDVATTAGAGVPSFADPVRVMTQNPQEYTGVDRRDSFWRQKEGAFQIRSVAACVTQVDQLYVIPLCVGTGRLRADVIPLETLADVNRPWKVQVKINRAFAGAVIGFTDNVAFGDAAGTAGSIVVDEISLHLYVIPIRDTEVRECGRTYFVRTIPRAQSPFQYNADEVIVLSCNMPDTQSTLVDGTTASGGNPGGGINGNNYQSVITYGDYSADLTAGNTQDLSSDSQTFFPPYYKNRNPRFIYEGLWNCNPRRHKIRLGYKTVGGAVVPRIVVRGGRDAVTQLGYQNIVDGTMLNLLGQVTPWPIRVIAATNFNMDGFPGFGTLTANCAAPIASFEGWLPDSDVWDVILNTDDNDVAYLQSLGGQCCDAEKPKWAATVDAPSAASGIVAAAGITPDKEIKLSDPAAKHVEPTDPKANSLGVNPSGKAAQ